MVEPIGIRSHLLAGEYEVRKEQYGWTRTFYQLEGTGTAYRLTVTSSFYGNSRLLPLVQALWASRPTRVHEEEYVIQRNHDGRYYGTVRRNGLPTRLAQQGSQHAGAEDGNYTARVDPCDPDDTLGREFVVSMDLGLLRMLYAGESEEMLAPVRTFLQQFLSTSRCNKSPAPKSDPPKVKPHKTLPIHRFGKTWDYA